MQAVNLPCDTWSRAADLDEVSSDDLLPPELPASPLMPADLEEVLNWAQAWPPGWTARPLDAGSYGLTAPGQGEVRTTTRPDLFDDHPENLAFFTPGGPMLEAALSAEAVEGLSAVPQDDGSVRLFQAGEWAREVTSFADLTGRRPTSSAGG